MAHLNIYLTGIFFRQGTFDFLLVLLGPVQVHGGGVPVQRVDGVGVGQQLGQERLKDVGQVWRREEGGERREERCEAEGEQRQHFALFFTDYYFCCTLGPPCSAIKIL